MSKLLARPPYDVRDDAELLGELNALTRHHRTGCPEYARIWPDGPDTPDAGRLEDVPFVHVGLFKRITLRTSASTKASEGPEKPRERAVLSSATTSGQPSRIILDERSVELQSASSTAILQDFVGATRRPLLVLDSARALAQRREMPARLAAAMSLQSLATEIHFLLHSVEEPASVRWDVLARELEQHDDILLYGFTYLLWLVFGSGNVPADVKALLLGKRVHFVHSGGWKKLEAISVDRATFDGALLAGLRLDASSRVVDYYGLVEQIGVIYPLCAYGYRHVPRWAAVIVRDTSTPTLDPLVDEAGQLQFLNPLAWSAPYHSVLTEDMGRIVPGRCDCGRSGPRFELLGRVPKAEVRGCANV
jgi:hypothetical protein